MKSRWLSLNFFAFFFTWGVFLPYWTGWLVSAKGLTVFQAGAVMGTGMFIRAFSTLFLFPAAARRFPIAGVMKAGVVLSFIIALLYIPAGSYTAILVVTAALNVVYPNLLPAMETSASILIQKDRINYSRSRAYGSAGYMVAVLIIGAVTALFGNEAILWTMFAGLLLMLGTQYTAVPVSLGHGEPGKPPQKRSGAFRELVRNRGFLIVLTVSVLLQGAHASYYNYGFVYLEDLGVASFTIGLVLNVAILFEILFFGIADRLFGNTPASRMFLLAAAGSTLRWVLIFLMPTVWMFTLTQVLHAASFGIAHVAFIRYISEKLPTRLIAPAQALYAAFAMSLSTAFLTLLGGALYEVKPGLSFLGMVICTVPAALIVFSTKKRFSY
ncbi:MFS transporter [Bhargavaea massiliensis]|uniref:MFS transporter n=1 Tax=Bhargavaea massiliensis TaxID=2697500 RepID=UPI001BCA7EBA|nr:MFS transporter [Bhargavaea massiliensis]